MRALFELLGLIITEKLKFTSHRLTYNKLYFERLEQNQEYKLIWKSDL